MGDAYDQVVDKEIRDAAAEAHGNPLGPVFQDWAVYTGMGMRYVTSAYTAEEAANKIAKREGAATPNHMATWYVYPLSSEVIMTVVAELKVDVSKRTA